MNSLAQICESQKKKNRKQRISTGKTIQLPNCIEGNLCEHEQILRTNAKKLE